MPKEIVCPQCGLRLPIDGKDWVPPHHDLQQDSFQAAPDAIQSRTVEMVLPATISNEGLPTLERLQGLDWEAQESIIDSRSDLEAIRFGDSEVVDPQGHSDSLALDVQPRDLPGSVDSIVPYLNGSGSGSHGGSGSSEKLAVFSQLDLSEPIAPTSPQQNQATSRKAEEEKDLEAEEEEEEEEDDDDRPSAWPTALLASYASVMTLICLWMWWNGQPASLTTKEDDFWAVEEGPDPGVRAARTVQFDPPPETPEAFQIQLGEVSQRGALEITPLSVSTGPVTLKRVRVDGRPETRDGEENVLKLQIRLRNHSSDLVFAPLDEAFLRDPDHKLPDSFLEDANGQRIYTYELPVYSEWSIEGQEFRELRPGEVFDSVIVSSAFQPQDLEGPLTWRIRVRTGSEQTEFLAVRFQLEDIVAEDES